MGFFKKNKEKETVKTFKDGSEQTPVQVPELEIPVPLPTDQNFKPGQEVELDENGNYRVVSDCFICHDHKFYLDARAVWHECPRCSNPPGALAFNEELDDKEVLKPGCCLRWCCKCGQKTQVHSSKKEFICEDCLTLNKFEKGGK